MAENTAYPVIFSGPMVRALLDGRKSQTRRLAWQCLQNLDGEDRWYPSIWQKRHDKFRAGERPWLYVRETCFQMGGRGPENDYIAYADEMQDGNLWDDVGNPKRKTIPSIHMPKWASRISLRVTGMRIERLQDISEEDARAEGVEPLDSEREERDWRICPKCGGTRLHDGFGQNYGVIHDIDCAECDTHQKRFRHLWDSIHGAWAENPEVVVTEFEIHRQNIGSVTDG